MKDLISHIEFLLLQHEYVIVPNLGGFVLHKEHASVSSSGTIVAPGLNIGFNVELKYNDGLLAESYMQDYSISYDAAISKIEEAVKHIKSKLSQQKVSFGDLGILYSENGNIIFNPSSEKIVNHPSVWGYSNVELRALKDVSNPLSEHVRKIKVRHVFAGVASTAAAVVLWAMSPLINENIFQTVQQSGFYVDNVQNVAKVIERQSTIVSDKELILDEYMQELVVFNKSEIKDEKEDPTEIKEVKKSPPPVVMTKEKRYYIIVGGDENKARASVLLAKIKNRGFKNAALVDSPERHRIYVASFKDKSEANAFLSRFKSQNPSFHDAWLYTKSIMVKKS